MKSLKNVILEGRNNPLETMLNAFRDECEGNNFDIDDCSDSLIEFFRMIESEFGDNGHDIVKSAISELYAMYRR